MALLRVPVTSELVSMDLIERSGVAFFGNWHPPTIPPADDDSVMEVSAAHEGQLDTLAFTLYGDRALFWVLAHRNQISDIQSEVVAGKTLIVPSAATVARVLSLAQSRAKVASGQAV